MNDTKRFLRKVALPGVFLGVFLSLWMVWRVFDLPSDEEMIEIIRRSFDRYGYWLVFVSAIIEGTLLVGWYYPGSLVIFLGVIFAGSNIPAVVWVVTLVTMGLFIAYVINYVLGRYGWYRLLLRFGLREPIQKAQTRLTAYGLRSIVLSYWHPNLAALTATAAGILRFPLKRFLLYSAVVATLWDIFWGTLAYVLGEAALKAIGIRFVIVVVVVWVVYELAKRKSDASGEVPLTS